MQNRSFLVTSFKLGISKDCGIRNSFRSGATCKKKLITKCSGFLESMLSMQKKIYFLNQFLVLLYIKERIGS